MVSCQTIFDAVPHIRLWLGDMDGVAQAEREEYPRSCMSTVGSKNHADPGQAAVDTWRKLSRSKNSDLRESMESLKDGEGGGVAKVNSGLRT
jgi:hypothetical protein